MGMYTELVLGVELKADHVAIDTLELMLDYKAKSKAVTIDHPLFSTPRWGFMLLCDSYYFGGRTDSKLVYDECSKSYYLNVRCNLKNYDNEIGQFLDWLCPYIETEGFLGYSRYEESDNPTLIYKENGKIRSLDYNIRRDEKELREQTRWIPVSERLPEIQQVVLLSLRSLNVEIGFRAKTEPYFYCHNAGSCYIEPQNVLAWQPLSQPYKESEDKE